MNLNTPSLACVSGTEHVRVQPLHGVLVQCRAELVSLSALSTQLMHNIAHEGKTMNSQPML